MVGGMCTGRTQLGCGLLALTVMSLLSFIEPWFTDAWYWARHWDTADRTDVTPSLRVLH